MVWELVGYGTEWRHGEDLRYLSYTTSEKLAKQFTAIPKIQFSDSGHGIVFHARAHTGKRRPQVNRLGDYVRTQLDVIRTEERRSREEKNAR